MSDDPNPADDNAPPVKKPLSPLASLGLGLLLVVIGVGGTICTQMIDGSTYATLIAIGIVGLLVMSNGLLGLFSKKE